VATWRMIYTAAILSTDPDCADIVLDEAARAMDMRLDELANLRGYEEEQREIALAAKSLLIIRAEWEESKLTKRDRTSMPPGEKLRGMKI
jgi:hypothetical protein